MSTPPGGADDPTCADCDLGAHDTCQLGAAAGCCCAVLDLGADLLDLCALLDVGALAHADATLIDLRPAGRRPLDAAAA